MTLAKPFRLTTRFLLETVPTTKASPFLLTRIFRAVLAMTATVPLSWTTILPLARVPKIVTSLAFETSTSPETMASRMTAGSTVDDYVFLYISAYESAVAIVDSHGGTRGTHE